MKRRFRILFLFALAVFFIYFANPAEAAINNYGQESVTITSRQKVGCTSGGTVFNAALTIGPNITNSPYQVRYIVSNQNFLNGDPTRVWMNQISPTFLRSTTTTPIPLGIIVGNSRYNASFAVPTPKWQPLRMSWSGAESLPPGPGVGQPNNLYVEVGLLRGESPYCEQSVNIYSFQCNNNNPIQHIATYSGPIQTPTQITDRNCSGGQVQTFSFAAPSNTVAEDGAIILSEPPTTNPYAQ